MGSNNSTENLQQLGDNIVQIRDLTSGSSAALFDDTMDTFCDFQGAKRFDDHDTSAATSVSTNKERGSDSKLSVNSEVSLLSQRLGRGRRSLSQGSLSISSEDGYGWFEDEPAKASLEAPASTTPIYVLESSLPSQKLWYETAGRRPKQPENERKYFEELWKANFEKSSINYGFKVQGEEPQAVSRHRQRSLSLDGEQDIIFKGKGTFSNSVSRSFIEDDFQTLTLQMPRFKILKLESGELRASFLVVININGVTFGVWKHHSEFKDLADKVFKQNMQLLSPFST